MKMSEVVRIDNSSVGGAELAHVEASLPNDIGALDAEEGFASMGGASAPPIVPLQKAPLGNFLERLTPIGTAALAATDTPFAQLAAYDPYTLFLSNAYIAAKIATFELFRGTLEVEIMVNAPAGCYGLYYLVAVPGGAYGTNNGGFGPYIVECLPHIMIDLSASTKGKLVLEWIHWNDYADLASTTTSDGLTNMWSLRLMCFNPIAQASGATTPAGTIALYARCNGDQDLLIPYQQGKKEPAVVGRVRNQVNTAVTKFTGGLKASQVSGKIASAATTLMGIPIIGSLAAPIAAGASAITSVLDYFGFTRTTDQNPPQPVVQRPFSNVANADGYDTGEIAALSVSNAISIDPRISRPISEDESSFDYLSQKYVMVAYYDWEIGDTNGTVLGSFPVTPFFSVDNTINGAAGAVLTVGGFLGLPFSKWRADMEYKLVIPFSKFHRGSLQVSWAPQYGAANPTNNQYNRIFDVTPNKVWEFVVGYANSRFMMESYLHASTDPVLSAQDANGIVSIRVVNPLECPVSTADVRIFVFARVCPGAQYAFPRTTWSPIDVGPARVNADFASTVQLQGGALGDDALEFERFELVPCVGRFPLKEVCMGEEVMSARMLVQKFSQDYGLSRTALEMGYDLFTTNHIPSYPSGHQYLQYYPNNSLALSWFNWFGWYASLFVGVAASTRYKFVNCTDDVRPIAVYPANTTVGRDYAVAIRQGCMGSVAPTWPVVPGEAVEVTVPYYFNHKFLYTLGSGQVEDVLEGTYEGRADVLRCPGLRTGEGSSYVSWACYSAAGPDVRFFYARFPRRVYYNPGGSVSPQYGNALHEPPG